MLTINTDTAPAISARISAVLVITDVVTASGVGRMTCNRLVIVNSRTPKPLGTMKITRPTSTGMIAAMTR